MEMLRPVQYFAEELVRQGVVRPAPAPVSFKSGVLSPLYVNFRRLAALPRLRDTMLNYIATQLREGLIRSWYGCQPCEVSIACVPIGGLLLGDPLADRMGLPFGYIAPKKGHGEGLFLEGFDTVEGRKLIFFEDMVTTAMTVAPDVSAMRSLGAEVKVVVSIGSYDLPQAKQRFGQLGVLHTPLVSYASLRAALPCSEVFTREDIRAVDEWHEDPSAWTNARVQTIEVTSDNERNWRA